MRALTLSILFIVSWVASAMTPPTEYAPLFRKYPADVVHTFVKPQVRFEKRSDAYRYREDIKKQVAKSEINFGGKWILVSVKCGKSCNRFFLVDGVSGVLNDPGLMIKTGAPMFIKESSLFIARTKHPRGWVLKNGVFESIGYQVPLTQ